jgi:flagellar biogenesis protein FliO
LNGIETFQHFDPSVVTRTIGVMIFIAAAIFVLLYRWAKS